MEIVVESDDSFLFEPCSTLGKLERPVFFIQRYFDAFSLRSRRGSSVVWTFFTMNQRRGDFSKRMQFVSLLYSRSNFSIVAHDRVDFTASLIGKTRKIIYCELVERFLLISFI